ncbi:MAG: hypothetical protein U0235_02420 [Polyangiaceae bacterium]
MGRAASGSSASPSLGRPEICCPSSAASLLTTSSSRPDPFFGIPNGFRLGWSLPEDKLDEGLTRLVAVLRDAGLDMRDAPRGTAHRSRAEAGAAS